MPLMFLHFDFQLKKHFTRDQHSHYIFTPKMLSKLIGSLKYYPEEYFQQVNLTVVLIWSAYQFHFPSFSGILQRNKVHIS